MRPRDDSGRDNAARFSARLQTLIGTGGGLSDLAHLFDEAVALLGPDHETTLEIEYRLEVRRDDGRSPDDLPATWEDLRARASAALPDAAPTAVAIRTRHLRQLRRLGRPGDLDLLVTLCRAEVTRRDGIGDLRWAGEARADLAWMLRDRAWFTGTGPADLAEAERLIDAEVRRCGSTEVPDHRSLTAARQIQAEVLLAAAAVAGDPGGRAGRALEIAEDLVQADDDEGGRDGTYDQLPPPHTLLAEALLAAGRVREAGRVARLAYALHAGSRVFDPARPLLVLAHSEGAATADAALHQRLATFPADSHYVAEARRLARSLRP